MEDVVVEKDINLLHEDTASILDKAKMARAQASNETCADIRKMVDNPDYSDVVFLCEDGERVHACRLFLVARSEVLNRMLQNGMTESKLSEIILHDISSTTLLPVMEFLYTGSLQEHAPRDWKHAYEIIGAARFFLLEGLELIAVDYLLVGTTEVGVDIEAAAKFLSITVEFIGILGDIVDLIARNLVCILESRSWKPGQLQGLTAEALLYFLEKTRNANETPMLLSRAESLRLKNIILWCICREFSPQDCPVLDAVPPEIKSILELWENWLFRPHQLSEMYRGIKADLDRGIKAALAHSIKQYLPMVNFRRIDPWELVNMFEPMDIIPSSAIMDAFRFHALQGSFRTEESFRWSTSSNSHDIYRVGPDWSAIQKMVPGIGFARYSLHINSNGNRFDEFDKFFEWEITIETVCDGFIEIGLHHGLYEDFDPQDGQSLSDHPGGWALRMDTQGLSISRDGNHRPHHEDPKLVSYNDSESNKDYSKLVYGKDYGHKNSKVKVCFVVGDNACYFTLDDDKLGITWGNIPEGPLFPAVSLGGGSNGRFRRGNICPDLSGIFYGAVKEKGTLFENAVDSFRRPPRLSGFGNLVFGPLNVCNVAGFSFCSSTQIGSNFVFSSFSDIVIGCQLVCHVTCGPVWSNLSLGALISIIPNLNSRLTTKWELTFVSAVVLFLHFDRNEEFLEWTSRNALYKQVFADKKTSPQ